jgi:hypothetical protein
MTLADNFYSSQEEVSKRYNALKLKKGKNKLGSMTFPKWKDRVTL